MRTIAVGRCIGLSIALISAAAAVYFGYEANSIYSDFDRWLVARPMTATVDFSAPGETMVPFIQTCSTAHGESVRLEIDPPPAGESENLQLVKGLAGEITIRDAGGTDVEKAKFDRSTILVRPEHNGLVLTTIYPFTKGYYTATIRINSPAPGLAAMKYSVFAQYDLCGLEQMPAVICAAIAIACGFLALVVGLFTAPGLFSHGLFHDPRITTPIEHAEATR